MSTAPETLGVLARCFERLVAEGRYEEARGALEQYGCALEAALRSLPVDDPLTTDLARDWRSLLAETRVSVLIGRAQAAARLASLPRAVYALLDTPGRTWTLIG